MGPRKDARSRPKASPEPQTKTADPLGTRQKN